MTTRATGMHGKWLAARHFNAAVRGLADWLPLAAAPTFAIMALLSETGGADVVCSAMHLGSPFGGMVPMYLLMSAFHLTPWLRMLRR